MAGRRLMVAVRSLALFRRTELGVYDGNGVVSRMAGVELLK